MVDMLSAYCKLAIKRYIDQVVVMVLTDAYNAPKRIDAIEQKLADVVMHAYAESGLFYLLLGLF
jgi:hypothetical protein